MRIGALTISLFLALLLQLPLAARAAWWGGGDAQGELNLDFGYDANTVITVSGRVVALYLDGPEPRALVAIEAGDGMVSVVLGPRNYWAEHGIALKIGDQVTVRGSKAQGKDGVVYLLAQWFRQDSRGEEIALRNESGQPVWAGFGNRAGQHLNRSTPLRQRSPGRVGGGRMGR